MTSKKQHHYQTFLPWLILLVPAPINQQDIKPIELPHVNTNPTESPIEAFVTSMASLSFLNSNHSLWWATDVASRNRVNALTVTEADNWILISQIIAFAEKNRLGITIADDAPSLLARATFLLAKSIGVPASYKAKSSALIRLKQIAKLAKESLRSTKWIYSAKRLYGRHRPSQKPTDIIRSFTYKSAFLDENKYRDPFFGNLSYHLNDNSRNSVTIVQGFSDRLECYALISPDQKGKIVPFEVFQAMSDPLVQLFRIVYAGIFHPLKFPKTLYLQQELLSDSTKHLAKINWAPLTQVALEEAIWTIQLPQLMAEPAGRRIANRYNIKSFLSTYEANPWELMLTKGLRSNPANFPILGYQHSVVPPAALGMFITKEEQKLRPAPDTIFTTGIAPIRILERYGKGNLGRTRPACALRYEYLFNSKPKNHRLRPIKTILVALEGLIEVADLVEYLVKEAPNNPTIEFVVRSHPVLPLEDILTYLQFTDQLPSNVLMSKNTAVEQDLEICDAVLYWGTTVALEAILYGKPIIHFSKGGIFNCDPLADLKNFKLCTNTHARLKSSIEAIDSWSQEIFNQEKTIAQSYVQDYFHPVNKETMTLFTC